MSFLFKKDIVDHNNNPAKKVKVKLSLKNKWIPVKLSRRNQSYNRNNQIN